MQMKNLGSLVALSLPVSLLAVACGSFSSGPGAGTPGDDGSAGSVGASSSGSGGSSGGSGDGVGGGNSGVPAGSGTGGSSSSSSGGSSTSGSSSGSAGPSGNSSSTGGSSGTQSSGATASSGSSSGGTGRSSSSSSGGTSDAGGAVGQAPCDILGAAGNACAAAHSTTRVLYAGYTGPLYQVCKGSSVAGPNSCPGGTTKDIGSIGGYADAASQDAFCAGGTCTISIIYDQSPNANHLKPAPSGGAKNTPDNPANATDLKTTLNGHTVYGVFIKPGIGYRSGCTGCATPTAKATATGDQPETEYMVTTNTGLVGGCCFDYG
ncbi:MAG: hypothetical protein JOZ69_23680, partial [Myxococcales bacterium]|nr:hypothetical protein [Myxococcales bacterium]